MLMALIFAGCGGDVTEEEPGDLGSGSGSPATSSNLASGLITSVAGNNLGYFAYDADYFIPLYTAQDASDDTFISLVNTDGSLSVTLSRALGRPDTLCRYLPAILARDEGFEIGNAGFKTNQQQIELYRTEANLGTDYRRYYCAEISLQSGVIVTALTSDPDQLEAGPFYSLLNSILAY